MPDPSIERTRPASRVGPLMANVRFLGACLWGFEKNSGTETTETRMMRGSVMRGGILTGFSVVCVCTLHVGCSTVPRFDDELASCTAYLSSPALESVVNFENQTSEVVSLSWVTTGSGNIREYHNLSPGEKYSQSTYIGHLWLMRGKRTDSSSTYCARDAVGSYLIR